MIISFNPLIFHIQDKGVQESIAIILSSLLKKNHLLDLNGIDSVFFSDGKFTFNTHDIAANFLADAVLIDLENFINSIVIKSAYITQLHQKHLTRIMVGQNVTEIKPEDAIEILKERSKVIVENGINDWKFIVGVCEKYTSHKQRGSIYRLIKQSIVNDELESDNAGGIGEIIKVIHKWITTRYRNIYKFKLLAIFDSDRQSSADFDTHKGVVAFFKQKEKNSIQPSDYLYQPNDLILWHILYKRKLENYVPLSILFSIVTTITPHQKKDLEGKTNDELDFIEYNAANIGIGNSKIKELFPEMFRTNFSYQELEQRCVHLTQTKIWSEEAQENISELEQLLLKIAKII